MVGILKDFLLHFYDCMSLYQRRGELIWRGGFRHDGDYFHYLVLFCLKLLIDSIFELDLVD